MVLVIWMSAFCSPSGSFSLSSQSAAIWRQSTEFPIFRPLPWPHMLNYLLYSLPRVCKVCQGPRRPHVALRRTLTIARKRCKSILINIAYSIGHYLWWPGNRLPVRRPYSRIPGYCYQKGTVVSLSGIVITDIEGLQSIVLIKRVPTDGATKGTVVWGK